MGLEIGAKDVTVVGIAALCSAKVIAECEKELFNNAVS
jgi:hypothetical protein